jgi:hypothetical protein
MAAVECQRNPLVGVIDTVAMYYVARIALKDEVRDYDNVVKYLNLCLTHNYFSDGDVNVYHFEAYEAKRDIVQCEKMAKLYNEYKEKHKTSQ